MLQTIWLADPFRPTRDLDLLGRGDSDPESLRAIFREMHAIECDDGVVFDLEGLSVEPIREETEYGGQRIETTARIAGARLKIRIDLGFGDAVTPDADEVACPVLLDQPAPKVRAYPKETVVAEKLQAIVALGATNGRMKDFYDLWMMSRHFQFEAALLAKAADWNRKPTRSCGRRAGPGAGCRPRASPAPPRRRPGTRRATRTDAPLSRPPDPCRPPAGGGR